MDRVAMLSVHGCPLAELGSGEAGGMQLYIRALSRQLGQLGLAVDVYTRRTSPALPTVVPFGPNARVIHLTAGDPAPVDKNAVFDLLPEFVCNLQSFRCAEEVSYQIVHSHYWLSGWVGNLLARHWDVPHVTMFHTLARLKNRALAENTESVGRIDAETRIVSAVDRIVVASEHERQALVDLYGARRERIEVIPGGVDLERFQPLDRAIARQVLGLSGEVLLFVGRMDPIKGLDVLLRAVALLKARPALQLVVVGGSGNEGELRRNRALVDELGLAERVQFRGAAPHEELPLYYNAADLAVIPSRYESFGLAAVEALACGTPVVASHVGGLPTIVRDGENGLLVPWRTPETFAERIAALLDDPDRLTALAARARPSVLRFGWDAVALRVADLYSLLSAKRQPSLAARDCP
jgi:D-inositol-3-phosphate glycosyltransferase